MRDAGQKAGFARVRADWMAVFQLADWMRPKVGDWVVVFPLAESHADDQKGCSAIHQCVKVGVGGYEGVYCFGWMRGH